MSKTTSSTKHSSYTQREYRSSETGDIYLVYGSDPAPSPTVDGETFTQLTNNQIQITETVVVTPIE